ncbi:hypothetical protein BCR33DRAFT_718793 [Rhizoclosmatium globosum]|uniref:Ankyrin n=1 Tax=Rhizoclosmatium globosum TaxID=329046 RepID=A0A1Y2C3M9_9FUNG|nr:hypothetical protein BCR33DRAFT_718793 [Rhizoclosmatium globosum]|eukprot:ORY41642.1 hypothetical protein BCR33DRAFT_718793 [Rhizoclosmatium globosum]
MFKAQYSLLHRNFKKSKGFLTEDAAREDAARLTLDSLPGQLQPRTNKKNVAQPIVATSMQNHAYMIPKKFRRRLSAAVSKLGVTFSVSTSTNVLGETVTFCIVDGVEFGHAVSTSEDPCLRVATNLFESSDALEQIASIKANAAIAKAEREEKDLIRKKKRDMEEAKEMEEKFKKLDLTKDFTTSVLKPGYNNFLCQFVRGEYTTPLNDVEQSVLLSLCLINDDPSMLEPVLKAVTKTMDWETKFLCSYSMFCQPPHNSDYYVRDIVTNFLWNDYMGVSNLTVSFMENQIGRQFLVTMIDFFLPYILTMDLDFGSHNIANIAAAIGYLECFDSMKDAYFEFDFGRGGELYDALPLVSAFGVALEYGQLEIAEKIIVMHENTRKYLWHDDVSQENWDDRKWLVEPRAGLLLHAVNYGHAAFVRRIYKMKIAAIDEVVVAKCRIETSTCWPADCRFVEDDVVADLLERDFKGKNRSDLGFSGRETVLALMDIVNRPKVCVLFRNVQFYAAAFGYWDILEVARAKNIGHPLSILAVGLAAQYGQTENIKWILKNSSVRLTDSVSDAIANMRNDFDSANLWCPVEDYYKDSDDEEESNDNIFEKLNDWKLKASSWNRSPVSRAIENGHSETAKALLDMGAMGKS